MLNMIPFQLLSKSRK